MTQTTILIPTANRIHSLCALLTSLYYQDTQDFCVFISDQSAPYKVEDDALFKSLQRLLRFRNIQVRVQQHLPHRGMAEQRSFLLDHVKTPYCFFLDDDVVLEPWVLRNLLQVMHQEQCGFAGNALIGLSFRNDHRPHQQLIEFWDDGVHPEHILPGTREWDRYRLHNAANILHVQEALGCVPDQPRPYKVAWVGGCVLYDTEKLRAAGGFQFWQQLPQTHCGEDVMAQHRVMEKYGGCGVIPSGAYHLELPTTLPDRTINAPVYLNNSHAE